MKRIKKLSEYITKLDAHIPKYLESNTKVSKSTIGWHIDHSLKVINNVIKTIEASDPTLYENDFSVLGSVFLTLGYFPRGKGKAPKHVKPPEIILKDDLIAQIETAISNIERLANLDKNSFFKHPLFGNVNTKRVYRFLEVHTKHHLKIIDDILKN